MKKKMNYLILLLMTIFIVGCTNVEDVSNTDVETDPQEVTTVETNTNNELFSGYKLIEVDGGDLSGYRGMELLLSWHLAYGLKILGITMNTGN